MGDATKRRKAILSKCPYCIFCGGNVPATTIEHCPPRSFFQNKQWPEGFEFPSCEDCNHGTSDDDLLVAMLGRLDPFTERGDLDGRHNGLMRAVSNQFPDLFTKLIPLTARDARNRNRKLGLSPAPGQTHLDVPVISVPVELHVAVCTFGRKLAKAIYYLGSSEIFPANGCLILSWFSNEEIVKLGKYQMLDIMKGIGGVVPILVRSGKLLNDQFSFKISMSDDKDLFALQVLLGKSFGFVVFGSVKPGVIEDSYQRLRQERGDGPFAIVASSILPVQPDFGFAEYQSRSC